MAKIKELRYKEDSVKQKIKLAFLVFIFIFVVYWFSFLVFYTWRPNFFINLSKKDDPDTDDIDHFRINICAAGVTLFILSVVGLNIWLNHRKKSNFYEEKIAL